MSPAIDRLTKARKVGINLLAMLELAEALRRRQCEQWLAENRPAIAAYNADVEASGVFSDGLRDF